MIIFDVVHFRLRSAEIREIRTMSVEPPSTIKWLVNAVGEDVALAFVESMGGRRVWVPRKWAGSNFAEYHGEEIAAVMSAQYGGEHYDVPLCREWRAMMLYCQGIPLSDIAFRVGCSRSAIIRILGGRTRKIVAKREQSQQDVRQFALFG
ncbi:hypothetical protein NBRC3257_1442 [Gluconobacter thailandicus NBRC 3257]|uniref:Uncharacterized protein n=2 Tax=Acetobacteraceae TaxID=433 RepID=A0ABQ0IW51_GLUTH|nr:hypothetical protein NBRC3257_1442 [Gluconobacter thailandicus NBRC 3257]